MIEKVLEMIKDAEREAFKKGIETNTIMLNDKFDFCKGFYRGLKLGAEDIAIHEYPPMILGKDVRLVDFLPEQYFFALTETNVNTNNYIKSLQNENQILKKYLKLVGEGDNQCLVVKGISTKKNKEDFEKIKELLNEENI